MPARRTFLISATAFIGASSLPGFAQRADVNLEADPVQNDAPIRRKYMMEDTYGNLVKDDDFQGKFVLVYFGYMSCPDVCPTTLSTISETMQELGDMNEELAVLFVTVDPDRDTPEKLHEYLGFFDKRIIGLRGPKPYTDHMVKAFNARYEFYYPDPDDKTEYSVDHTASVAFVDPYGNLIKRFPHGMSSEAITTDIRTIIDGARID
ncbi:SCO family protein [Profundibacter sp.]